MIVADGAGHSTVCGGRNSLCSLNECRSSPRWTRAPKYRGQPRNKQTFIFVSARFFLCSRKKYFYPTLPRRLFVSVLVLLKFTFQLFTSIQLHIAISSCNNNNICILASTKQKPHFQFHLHFVFLVKLITPNYLTSNQIIQIIWKKKRKETETILDIHLSVFQTCLQSADMQAIDNSKVPFLYFIIIFIASNKCSRASSHHCDSANNAYFFSPSICKSYLWDAVAIFMIPKLNLYKRAKQIQTDKTINICRLNCSQTIARLFKFSR